MYMMMSEFVPDDGRPPRIVRFVNEPRTGYVAKFDYERNLLVINKGSWATLGQSQREYVLRTTSDVTWDDLPDEFAFALAAE